MLSLNIITTLNLPKLLQQSPNAHIWFQCLIIGPILVGNTIIPLNLPKFHQKYPNTQTQFYCLIVKTTQITNIASTILKCLNLILVFSMVVAKPATWIQKLPWWHQDIRIRLSTWMNFQVDYSIRVYLQEYILMFSPLGEAPNNCTSIICCITFVGKKQHADKCTSWLGKI